MPRPCYTLRMDMDSYSSGFLMKCAEFGLDAGISAALLKCAVAFSDDGSTFTLSDGESPSHAVAAWNSANPERPLDVSSLLGANPGVSDRGYRAGRAYAMPRLQTPTAPAPNPSTSLTNEDRARSLAIRNIVPFIKNHEEFRSRPYGDAGSLSIGYGLKRINGRPVRHDDVIDEPTALAAMNKELESGYDWMSKNIPRFNDLDLDHKALMLDLYYNGGSDMLSRRESPNLWKALLDTDGHPDPNVVVRTEYPTYRKSNGEDNQVLIDRRRDGLRDYPGASARASAE